MLSAVDRFLHVQYQNATKFYRKQRYQLSGRKPLTTGYWDYRYDSLKSILENPVWLTRFAHKEPLPPGYGTRLDERIVEYPWLFSRLSSNATRLLDAGSTLNHRFLLDLPILRQKKLVIYTLAPEATTYLRETISYIYGDLRATILKDELFDEIVCVSTLEHVGMNNTRLYTRDQRYKESRPKDYRVALRELHRLLVPGGRLFLTVPYGRYQNLGWQQQFDQDMLSDALAIFGGTVREQVFFRYTPTGWILSNAEECADCEYCDLPIKMQYDPDFAAAARAVACIEIVK
ncbi:hypothetical protein ANRL3_01940 [Anaerolineae bacterium]|nr:hypothetical protein ANRL3_01940 [Anaerolineae bacterium]